MSRRGATGWEEKNGEGVQGGEGRGGRCKKKRKKKKKRKRCKKREQGFLCVLVGKESRGE